MNRTRFLAFAAFATACASATPDALDAGPDMDLDALSADTVLTGRVVACFDDAAQEARALRALPGATKVGETLGCTVLETGADAVAATRTLRALDGVAMAEPEVMYDLLGAAMADDPAYPLQWHMDTIRAPEAWAQGATGEGVLVAVIDSGVATEGVDTPSLVEGWDFVDGDADARDTDGGASHGTHVAGTIAQVSGNGAGGVGVAPDAQVLPIRVCMLEGCPTVAIAAGIHYAIDSGADVINMSLGSTTPSRLVRAAVARAIDAGVVVVAASGNDGADAVGYPAAYPGVIAVGATDALDRRAPYSNGGEALSLVAPGGHCYTWINTPRGSFLSPVDDNGDGVSDCVFQEARVTGSYRSRVAGDVPGPVEGWGMVGMQGTSMASPHVAGTAALLVGMGADADLVRDVLVRSAVDLGEAGWDAQTGAGLLDAAEAVAQMQEALDGAR